MNTTSRLVYAWARNGTLFSIFSKVNKETGTPRASLWLSFGLAVFGRFRSLLGTLLLTYAPSH